MRERVLMQATEEREGWKKILGLLIQENIWQKNKLAEMLKAHEKDDDENLLETAERYQSQFLQQDETFRIMWNDLASLERSIDKGMPKREADIIGIACSQDKLRREMKNLQTHFNELNAGFRNFFEALVKEDQQN